MRTETTHDQDHGTESDCGSMYSVHCRVIVDNRSEFDHVCRGIGKEVKKCKKVQRGKKEVRKEVREKW